MKRDEPFNPHYKSSEIPNGLIFRSAERKDLSAVCNLMAERNPTLEFSQVYATTNREFERLETDPSYKIYVADLTNEVVGFCRFFHTAGMPENKKIYPSPEGWYGMGIIVAPLFRRKNIARFIASGRVEVLKKLGVQEFYSIVDRANLTSMKMHQELGFVEVSRETGFLNLKFHEGMGCLFKLTI
jgi:L-amino acid N-acyltransferase YncA